jgi:hypothetical protein
MHNMCIVVYLPHNALSTWRFNGTVQTAEGLEMNTSVNKILADYTGEEIAKSIKETEQEPGEIGVKKRSRSGLRAD